MNNEERKKQADKFLYEMGLWNELKSYGEPHIIGSYRVNLMAWNDLDIDITNINMSIEKLYELSNFIIKTFKPVWYEAKQEITDEGKTVWFHGFETNITGELWNFDLWFFDIETITLAEQYCDDVMRKINVNPICRDTILSIKDSLIKAGKYGSEMHTSMDVYKAVLDNGIKDIDDFFKLL